MKDTPLPLTVLAMMQRGLFSAPIDVLPLPCASDALFGTTAAGATALSAGVPIHAMTGDSHAALDGHGVRAPGTVKATYGTGSSLMTLSPTRTRSTQRLSGTVAWISGTATAHALEGNITVSAQAAAFMAALLGLSGPAELSDLARTVPDSGGVAFVPALAGLGAPHRDDAATATLTGMSHGTTQAHLARATFEAIALQVADVFDAMEADVGYPLQACPPMAVPRPTRSSCNCRPTCWAAPSCVRRSGRSARWALPPWPLPPWHPEGRQHHALATL